MTQAEPTAPSAPQSAAQADRLPPETSQTPQPNDSPVADPVATPTADPREVECIAKVIVHEAANQPYKGMVAVAQVITNRMKDRRFPKTACAVVNQPRQFFNVNAYNPSRKTRVWQTALQIAEDALQERAEPIVPGALYFNSVGGGMPGRTAISQIGDHVFYR